MSSEETLIQVRRDKHQELNGGTYPLANDNCALNIESTLGLIDQLIKLDQVRTTIVLDEAKGTGTRVLRGRISALRKSGALTFLKLTDTTGSIQLVAAKNNLSDYDKLKLLDLGDIVEVTGSLVFTKTGERSLLLSEWRVLTKSHLPPPEKFVGIADSELKSRKRYLDLMSSEETRARFIVRTYVIRAIREYMETRGFLEVETSTLSVVASGANAKPFITHHNALDINLRLRIAPELNLKRLLVGGLDRVYEIGRNYRNEGIDTSHNPEFTMMEAYNSYGNFPDLIIMTKALLRSVDDFCERHLPKNVLPFYQKWRSERPFSWSQFTEVSLYEAVMTGCGKAELSFFESGCELFCGGCVECDIHYVEPWNTINTRRQKIDIDALNKMLAQATSPSEKWMIMFDHVAEPFLTEDYRSGDDKHSCPVIVNRYPKDVCPLARANDWRTGECDRFELFVEGMELANAFQELNDPDEQEMRFKEQLRTNNKDPMDYDADYVEALQHGMPPAIGLGVGIDRLIMLLTNTTSVKDVILFPTLRPEK